MDFNLGSMWHIIMRDANEATNWLCRWWWR